MRAGAILSHPARPLRPRGRRLRRGSMLALRMIGITITAEAYEAIAATLPFGSVSFERD